MWRHLLAIFTRRLDLISTYIIPFAAVPEDSREIDGLDDQSELAHPIMLVNLLRLLVLSRPRRRAIKLLPVQRKSSFCCHLNHRLFGNGFYCVCHEL